MARVTSIATLALVAALATPLLASNAIVPDAYPTIQQAIDSSVDTVFVRQGHYAESVTLASAKVLLGTVPVPIGTSLFSDTQLPEVDGLTVSPLSDVSVSNLNIKGQGQFSSNQFGRIRVQNCRFEAGLTSGGTTSFLLLNCIVFGNCTIGNMNSETSRNTIVGGTLSVDAASQSNVRDNVVIGPAPVGIIGNTDTWLDRNYVRGCVTGIQGHTGADHVTTPSRIALEPAISCRHPSFRWGRCSPETLRAVAAGTGSTSQVISSLNDNVAEDCAQGGIVLGTGHLILRNTVLRSGVPAFGARISASDSRTTTSSVLTGDGITMPAAWVVAGNIVGHCTGRGIGSPRAPARLGLPQQHRHTPTAPPASTCTAPRAATRSPTTSPTPTPSASPGAARSAPFLGCNDWFGNASGSVTGTPVGATDVSLNPLFCDLPNDIVSLSAGSPLVSLAGCGLVGALGVGCTAAVSASGVRVPRHSATCA